MLSMMFARRLASAAFDQLGSISRSANLLFTVCISRSTIPVPLWSPVGASISFMFLF